MLLVPACVTVFVLPPSVVVVALAFCSRDDDRRRRRRRRQIRFEYLRSAFLASFRRVTCVSLKALPLLDSSVGAFVDVATNATLVVAVVVVGRTCSSSLSLSFSHKEVEEERSDSVCAFPFLCRKMDETNLFFDLSTKNEMKPLNIVSCFFFLSLSLLFVFFW